MSSSNLDLIKSIYVDWERGDFSSAEWADPEIELVLVDGPGDNSWVGLAAMAEGWGEFLSTWEDLRAVPDEYRELDDEHVLVVLHNVGRGKASGVDLEPISQRSANLFEIRDGKVTRIEAYWDAEPVLAKFGLDP